MPWVFGSVSDESQDASRGGGGTMQIWRMSEFVLDGSLQPKGWAKDIEEKFSTSNVGGVAGGNEEEEDE